MLKFKVPHTLILLFGMVVLALLLTYILPQGTFERQALENGREAVVPGSYSTIEDGELLNPVSAFTAIPKGLSGAKDIIFFIFIVGGAFAVLRATGTVDAVVGKLLKVFGKFPFVLILLSMAGFAVLSSTFGMAEEYIPFVPILLTLCIALGYDAMTAVAVMCVGYGIGYGTAMVNPFTVFVAQDVAGVPLGSDLLFRFFLMVVFLVIGVAYVWRYACKVKANPAASLVADIEMDASLLNPTEVKISVNHILVLIVTFAGLAVMIVGITVWGWYLTEMGALFLILTVLIGLLAQLNADFVASEFCKGAAELTTTALLIGVARAIEVVLTEGKVIDTIVNAIAKPLSEMGPSLAAIGMFFFQSICNFFIPSGSGQAYVTMPIMAPLADLVGVSRQIAVIAFQFGDGFTNILVPTNAVLVAILAMARIPYDRWLRFILPFMAIVWILGSLAMVLAVALGI